MDSDDTASTDTPERYLELARFEGFFIAAKFDADQRGETRESLWVLNEPYSGLLLTVSVGESEVLDASLHYNLRTDDTTVLNAAFPEHRDLASGTVYVRESCVEGLRARCRRARASGGLERQWRVAPTIQLLTPSEWETVDDSLDSTGTPMPQELNRRRVDLLPELIRRQFRLGPEREPEGQDFSDQREAL